MIIESKLGNLNVDIFRIFLGVIAVIILIYLLPINLNATIVFLAIILLFLILSGKTKIEINNDCIVFKTIKIFGFLNSEEKISFSDIIKVDYYPQKMNWLIFFLPGVGAYQSTKYIFQIKGKKSITEILQHNDRELIKKFNDELESKVKVEYHK